MTDKLPHLFAPFTIRGQRFKNRIFSTGHMTVMLEDGYPNDQMVAYHRARAKGGAGLIILEAARVAGLRLLSEIRELNEEAIPAMQKRGLNVIQVDEATRAHWRSEADKTYPELRGRYAPADLFDEVRRLRDEFRRKAQPARQ